MLFQSVKHCLILCTSSLSDRLPPKHWISAEGIYRKRVTRESSSIQEPRYTMVSCVWAVSTCREPLTERILPSSSVHPSNLILGQERAGAREGSSGKNPAFEVKLIWDYITALLCTSCVALVKLFNLSESLFPVPSHNRCSNIC